MNEVVIVLPYVGDTVLMQLRDDKEGIDFPGCWGFFGGAIDLGESPTEAAKREVEEELELRPEIIVELSHDKVCDLGGLGVHSFFFYLDTPLQDISLHEGEDLGLFTIDEINSKKLYSPQKKRNYPVGGTDFIAATVALLFKRIEG